MHRPKTHPDDPAYPTHINASSGWTKEEDAVLRCYTAMIASGSRRVESEIMKQAIVFSDAFFYGMNNRVGAEKGKEEDSPRAPTNPVKYTCAMSGCTEYAPWSVKGTDGEWIDVCRAHYVELTGLDDEEGKT